MSKFITIYILFTSTTLVPWLKRRAIDFLPSADPINFEFETAVINVFRRPEFDKISGWIFRRDSFIFHTFLMDAACVE